MRPSARLAMPSHRATSPYAAFGWGMGRVFHGKEFPQENLIWPSYQWRKTWNGGSHST